MTGILLICASARQGSYNRRLIEEVARYIPSTLTIDRLDSTDCALPLFDAGLEDDLAILAPIAALHQRIAAAEAVIVASPEYNGLPPPLLVNLLAWLSRLPHLDAHFDNAFADRPVLLCSASSGWSGGATAIPALRTLFASLGAIPYGDALSLPLAGSAWDRSGGLHDVMLEYEIGRLVGRFCAMVERMAKPATGVAA